MGGITPHLWPHLWYDDQAVEAATFYSRTFPHSRVVDVTTMRDTPSGDTDVVAFELWGQPFAAISAGPLFRFNPSISFLVACDTPDEVDRLWSALADGGTPLMPLDRYPFSDRYGWTEDRYGLSWQLRYAPDREDDQRITPTLLFVGEVAGRAEEAVRFYTDVFPRSGVGDVLRYGADDDPEVEGTVKHAGFVLDGTRLAAMDSALDHDFGFNEAVSLMVGCGTQDEIDHYWDRLSAVPEAEQCGWLKDRFGVSWQIVPDAMDAMLRTADPDQLARVTAAFLPMKKLDVAALQRAYDGEGPSPGDG